MDDIIKLLKKSYSGALSINRIRSFAQKLKKMHAGYWIKFEARGESRSYYWVAIRKGGKDGLIIDIRDFRDPHLEKSFSSILKKLREEKQAQEEQLNRRQKPKQLRLFGS